MRKGLIHLCCGDGKGKTTSAVGAAIRCSGAGGKVLMFQFLKDNSSSERRILEDIDGIELLDGYYSNKFVWDMTDGEKAAASRFYSMVFNKIVKLTNENEYDMLVLDEVFDAVDCGFIPREQLTYFIDNKPCGLEVIMTGRKPYHELIERADYITYMKKIKHPFDSGIGARKMIEY